MRDLQRSLLLVATINAHRDPKKSRLVTVNDVSVFEHRKPLAEQTPEQQASILRGIAQHFKRMANRKKKDGS